MMSAPTVQVAEALRDHWQTSDTRGGLTRDVCGRCKSGDGLPFLWPCPTRRALTGEELHPHPRGCCEVSA